MIKNFQLALIVKAKGGMRLLQVPLHQSLQNTLTVSWQAQYEAFTDGTQEIDFNAGYTPEEHERFRIAGYELPAWLKDETSQTVAGLDPISEQESLIESAKGVMAFARNEHGEEMMLFQNFSRSHVIRPGSFLLLRNDTYESVERPGLTLDGKLSALFWAKPQKLLFHNFRITNTFLPLADFYEEASEQEILEILEHDLLAPEAPQAMASESNQWFRKRFAMLRDSGILNKFTAKQIAAKGAGYGVEVQLDGDKIVFPEEKAAAKRLLQFLNEEIFRGAITETLYETNSKREADQ